MVTLSFSSFSPPVMPSLLRYSVSTGAFPRAALGNNWRRLEVASWIRAPPALSAIQLSNKSSANQNEIDCAPFKVRGRKHRVVVQMAWAAKWALTATAPLTVRSAKSFSRLGPRCCKRYTSRFSCAHVYEWLYSLDVGHVQNIMTIQRGALHRV